MLTRAELKAALSYDPEMGLFHWREKVSRKVVVGSVAGSRTWAGYTQITLFGHVCLAHRLAWLYMTGEWPSEVDHVNGDRRDNRWCNLRECTAAQNRQNRSASHVRGYTYYKPTGKWQARIKKDGKSIALGYYRTAEEASAAYRRAKTALHEFSPELRGA